MAIHLDIHGDISEGLYGGMDVFFGIEDSGTFGLKNLKEFLAANKEEDELIVHLNSRGGDVDEGFAIYDELINSGKKITMIGEGRIYSIASVIFMAGSKRIINEGAEFLIHLPFIPEYTLANSYTADELEKISGDLRHFENKIANFYSQKLGKTEVEMIELMKEDKYLSPQDALDLGFATEIKKTFKAYAYKRNKLNNKADMTNIEIKNELLGIRQIISDFKNLFKPNIQNMKKADVTGVEVDFGTAQNEAEIVEGLEGVMVDGKPATGQFIFSDFKVTVENGKVTKRETVEEAGDEEMENLKNENEGLKKEIEDLKASKTEVENSFSNFKAEAENKFKDYFDKFEAFQNKFPDAVIQNLAGSPGRTIIGNDDVPLFVKRQK